MSIIQRFFDIIYRYKFTIIGSLLLVLSILVILHNAKIETRIETFLPGYKPGRPIEEIDDPAVQNMVRMALKFGDSANVSILYNSRVPLDHAGALERLRTFQKKLEGLKDVRLVISILNYPGADAYFENDAVDIRKLPSELRNFVSEDGHYAMFLVVLSVSKQVEPVVRRLTDSLKGEPILVLSEPSVNNKLFDELKRSMFFYPVLMFLVILSLFFYQTQSLRAAWVSLFIPVLSSIYTYALYFFFGGVLNVLTSMTASFLIIIGSAYPLHYYNAIFRTEDVRKHISIPIFFSMLTTAVGFMSFLFVKIPAFKEFGLLVSIGLFLDFLLTITIGHELLGRAKRKTIRTPKSFGIRYFGNKTAIVILIILVFFTVLSVYYLPKLKVGFNTMDYFSEKSDIRKAYKVLEEKFGMKESIYLVLEKESGVFLPFDDKNIDSIIKDLSDHPEVASVDFPRSVSTTALIFASRTQPVLRRYIADGRTIRLSINLTPTGAEDIDKVTEIINKTMQKFSYKYYVSGTPYIMKAINDSILSSQIQSIVVALILVFVMLIIVFRDLAESVKLISPVLFATILNFFYMSVFGMKLEISTAITSSIIIGLAIDYSIHLGHDYNKTGNVFTSIKNVGPAIVGNALGIIFGFLTLLIGGELVLFKRISILVSLGIFTAALLTLTVLPFMLSFQKVKKLRRIGGMEDE
ncbi:MAG: efflux RND transporter permease subunit [Fervidobacterium sp.]|uniref:efflux RND transporter permease subunit n=1 Tax=Fervidobacterium sp. TaxID=1871331 RepID=UPI0040498D04